MIQSAQYMDRQYVNIKVYNEFNILRWQSDSCLKSVTSSEIKKVFAALFVILRYLANYNMFINLEKYFIIYPQDFIKSWSGHRGRCREYISPNKKKKRKLQMEPI